MAKGSKGARSQQPTRGTRRFRGLPAGSQLLLWAPEERLRSVGDDTGLWLRFRARPNAQSR